VTVIVEQKNTPSNKPPENQTDEDIRVQRKLATFTEWLVVVGLLQALILAFTVWVVRDQASAAKNSERAWMIGSPNMQRLLLDTPPEPSAQLLYVCNLKNTGRTPARILQTGLAFRKAKSFSDIPQTPSYEKKETFSFTKVLIVPQDSFASTTVSQVTKAEYLAVSDSGERLILYAYGFVKYLDVFGKPRETCFCHYYHVPTPYEAQIEGFRLCVEAPPAYNKAT
jgi:hypothetical protein